MKARSTVFSLFIMLVLLTGMAFQVTPAYAADQTIGGTAASGNLRITVKDNGAMTVEQYDGTTWLQNFYPGSTGDAKGTNLWAAGTMYNMGGNSTWSPSGGVSATPVSNAAVGDTITTVWTTANGMQITQTTQYTDGNQFYNLTWAVQNTTGADITDLKLFHGGDTLLAGSDAGIGWWGTMGSNTVGVTHPTSGQLMWLKGVTAPSHYDSIDYGTARSHVDAGALTDTVDPNPTTDNGYALQWNNATLAAGATWTVQAVERFAPAGTYPEPTITSINPTSGPAAGGTSVTIYGTNLDTVSAVIFGGVDAACTAIISPSEIVCTTGAHAAGLVDVAVTTYGGTATLAGAYTYIAAPVPPTITGIVPNSGPVAGGTTVVITGTALTGFTSVTFGGTEAALACTLTVANTEITCTTPAHAAGAVDVVVTTPDGSYTSTGGFTYLAPPAPAITGIAPNFGPAAGGTTVVITGTNLTGGTVTFGGLSATCTVDSATQITCATPAHAAGPVDVVVTTPDGSVTSTGGFNYVTVLTSASVTGCPPFAGIPFSSGAITIPPAGGTGFTDVDVVFIMDTTGSMAGQIAAASAGAIDIMNNVKGTFPGAQFAVIEYKDYPPEDSLPFQIHQALTTDGTLVSTALSSLSASGGGDYPESAGAAFIAGQGLAWRGGTVGKFYVLITDAPAQETDVLSGKSIDTILGEMQAADIHLLVVATSGSEAYWNGKAALAGDRSTVILYIQATFVTDVTDLILGAASRTLGWSLSDPTYNSWVSSVPASIGVPEGGGDYTFSVTVTVPDAVTGSHNFTIIYKLDGVPVAIQAVSVNAVCAPNVANIAPNYGPVAGGTAVVITGTKFTGTTSVTFGGAEAFPSCTVVSDTEIDCTTPAHELGVVDVVVTSPAGPGTFTNGFTYYPAPTISEIFPNAGPITGGTEVVITGTNFYPLPDTVVTFGGLTATCTVDSTTQLTCTTPAHAVGPVDVVVTTTFGGAGTFTKGFTYYEHWAIFYSDGTLDGWVKQKAPGVKAGGQFSNTLNIPVGDDIGNRQIRSILSFKTFNTKLLPANAKIGAAFVRIKQLSTGGIIGKNPFSIFGKLYVDIKKGYFGTSQKLAAEDYLAQANAVRMGSFNRALSGTGWYTMGFSTKGLTYINRSGTIQGGLTQLRLYFFVPTNKDKKADFFRYYPGDARVAQASRPQLIIYYTLP